MGEPLQMTQTAPYPHALQRLVDACTYRPGWTVELRHLVRDHVDPADDSSAALSEGLTLIITTRGYDSYHPERGEFYGVHHFRPVPPATFVDADWQRWLFEQFVAVELHEAMEFFTINDAKPYAPLHGPGRDPYLVHDLVDAASRGTSFRGVQKTAKHAAAPPVNCPSHNPIQHRDMKPPWCPICGLTEDFQQPEARPGPPPTRGG